jgi:hypothetical protein
MNGMPMASQTPRGMNNKHPLFSVWTARTANSPDAPGCQCAIKSRVPPDAAAASHFSPQNRGARSVLGAGDARRGRARRDRARRRNHLTTWWSGGGDIQQYVTLAANLRGGDGFTYALALLVTGRT